MLNAAERTHRTFPPTFTPAPGSAPSARIEIGRPPLLRNCYPPVDSELLEDGCQPMPGVHQVTRRQMLQVAGGGAGAESRGPVARAGSEQLAIRARPIKACILIFYYGGPSHLDTFDLKPDAPAEVRGEFKPIATTVPGSASASTCRSSRAGCTRRP